MLDAALINGLIALPGGERRVDVGVKDGLIAAITEPGELGQADETHNVAGCTVVPGGIDPHVHCDMAIQDPNGGPDAVSEGPATVSKAALIGGTTCLIDFIWKGEGESIEQAADRVNARWSGDCLADYSFHIVFRGDATSRALAEIPDAIAEGYTSTKVFTTNVTPHAALAGLPLKLDFGSLAAVLATHRDHGGIVAVHAEDDDIVQYNYRRMTEAGTTDYALLPKVHSALSEDLSFRRVTRLAQQLGGGAIYFMHVSASEGVEAIREARGNGLAVFGETLHQYALRTQADYLDADGMKYHTYPSLKTELDTARLWRGVADGDIACFATDEQCTSYAVKTYGHKIDDVVGGNTGIEPRMAILYTEMVDRRRMNLTRYVEATSTNAAKIFGMYPRKGAIQVGADADFVALRTGIKRNVTIGDLHESDYTPWEGWPVTAWPHLTMLRGHLAARDGELLREARPGRRVDRQPTSVLPF